MTQPTSDPIGDIVDIDVPVSIHQCPLPRGPVEEAAYRAAVAAADTLSDALLASDGMATTSEALHSAETNAIASLLAYRELLYQRP